jgi:hypothetical protein
MNAKDPDGSSEPNPTTISGDFDLHRILTHGADAVPPDPAKKIAAVRVSKMVLIWNNASHDVLTHQADDLLRNPNPQAQHRPRGANLAETTFELEVTDAATPVIVEIQSPHKLKLSHPALAPRLLAWFLQCQLVSAGAKLLGQITIVIAITIAAWSPFLDDDSLDDDDDDDQKATLVLRR